MDIICSYFLLFRYTWPVSELSLGAGLGSWLTWEWSVACDEWRVVASAERLRVIGGQVENTQSRARECDEPEMRTTRRCNIQSAVTGQHHVTS